jgi:hypothetical protein
VAAIAFTAGPALAVGAEDDALFESRPANDKKSEASQSGNIAAGASGNQPPTESQEQFTQKVQETLDNAQDAGKPIETQ